MLAKTRVSDALRTNAGGGIAALALALVTGGVLALWQASRRAEPDINDRTWARLVPRAPSASAEPTAAPSQEG